MSSYNNEAIDKHLNKNTPLKDTLKRLIPYISPFKYLLILAAIGLMIGAFTESLMIYLLKPLLNNGFSGSAGSFLRLMALAVVSLIALRGISNMVANYSLDWVSQKIIMKIRQDIFAHLLKLPTSFFDTQANGKLVSRITYDSEQVALASAGTMMTIVKNLAYIISLIAIMLYASWKLAMVLFVIAPIVGILIQLVSKAFRKTNKKIQTSMGKLTNATSQMIDGHKVILSFNGQDFENARFVEISDEMRRTVMKNILIGAFSNPIIQVIASLALALTLVLASYHGIFQHGLSAGAFAVVFSSMIALMRPINSILGVNNSFQRGIAACQTLFAMLDIEPEENTGVIDNQPIEGDIEFTNVNFKYITSKEYILNNLSFKIPKNSTVAFVGTSGSGKTTITSLITRLYDIDAGSITIDGINIEQYKLDWLRENCAVVSQDVHLFDDTLFNNILYGSGDKYKKEDVIEAVKEAFAWDFITEFPDGLNTRIGEDGISLSGGQRQRIAIARALLRKSPILILDEATSALDSESEKSIKEAIDRLKAQHNKTIIIIAHRLSTVLNSDCIMVLDHGNIIDQGTHEELLAHNGTYSRLYNMQFK